jgi:hypothetical protein
LPNKLSRVVAEFEARPDLDVLVDSFIKNCEPGARRAQVERRNASVTSNEEFRRRLFARELWKPTPALTVRKEAAIRAGLFNESVRRRQDLDLLIRLAQFATCAAIPDILWVKSWSADSISAGDHFVDSTLDLVKRHPEYLRERRFRVGLARDLARHVIRLVRRGRMRQAAHDIRRIRGALGPFAAGRLLVGGSVRHAARKFRQRREPGISPTPSTRAAAEPEAARNRASARS